VNKHLKELNIKYQEVISLRYFEQRSVKEIAVILDKKEGTVKSLLSRGITKLKEKIL
jgi:RNA polymerase sigma-70 factor (ECF subfamily)